MLIKGRLEMRERIGTGENLSFKCSGLLAVVAAVKSHRVVHDDANLLVTESGFFKKLSRDCFTLFLMPRIIPLHLNIRYIMQHCGGNTEIFFCMVSIGKLRCKIGHDKYVIFIQPIRPVSAIGISYLIQFANLLL